jgi:hypothetical protein
MACGTLLGLPDEGEIGFGTPDGGDAGDAVNEAPLPEAAILDALAETDTGGAAPGDATDGIDVGRPCPGGCSAPFVCQQGGTCCAPAGVSCKFGLPCCASTPTCDSNAGVCS